jgi:hypothetical protein
MRTLIFKNTSTELYNMSAWMCSDTHLSALANAMVEAGIVPDRRAEEYFTMLVAQNKASLDARYEDAADMYEVNNKFLHSARFASNAEAVKNCHCYAYQACEDDGWDDSEAKACVDALEAVILNKLGKTYDRLNNTPEYNAAKWGI